MHLFRTPRVLDVFRVQRQLLFKRRTRSRPSRVAAKRTPSSQLLRIGDLPNPIRDKVRQRSAGLLLRRDRPVDPARIVRRGLCRLLRSVHLHRARLGHLYPVGRIFRTNSARESSLASLPRRGHGLPCSVLHRIRLYRLCALHPMRNRIVSVRTNPRKRT